jgi:hypothetical protein
MSAKLMPLTTVVVLLGAIGAGQAADTTAARKADKGKSAAQEVKIGALIAQSEARARQMCPRAFVQGTPEQSAMWDFAFQLDHTKPGWREKGDWPEYLVGLVLKYRPTQAWHEARLAAAAAAREEAARKAEDAKWDGIAASARPVTAEDLRWEAERQARQDAAVREWEAQVRAQAIQDAEARRAELARQQEEAARRDRQAREEQARREESIQRQIAEMENGRYNRGSASQPQPAAPPPVTGPVRPNGYGLGVNQDQYGNPHTYRLENGEAVSPIFQGGVQRNAYGPGVHMDQFGRPVRDGRP